MKRLKVWSIYRKIPKATFDRFQRTTEPGKLHSSSSSSKEPLGRMNRFGPVLGEPACGSLVRLWRFFRRFYGSAVRAGSEPIANGSDFGMVFKLFGTGSIPGNPLHGHHKTQQKKRNLRIGM